MYRNKGSYKFDTSKGSGETKITLEIFSLESNFLDSEALEDPVLTKIISTYLTAVGIILTNVLFFYKKSPLMSTFIAGSLNKETLGKNDFYKTIMRELP